MAGRPKANIDWIKVNKMLQAHCNGLGIAGILGIDYDTLTNRCKSDHNMVFSEYRRQKQAEGKELLRQKMFAQAMIGDKTMLIWLSKQYLNMRENIDANISGSEPVKVSIKFSGNKKDD